MQFQKEITIEADADRVWEVVAHEFDSVGTWSSAVQASSANLDAAVPEGATVGGRVCATDFGDLKETFTSYSEADMRFTFVVTGMPGFITHAQNTVAVRPAGPGAARVSLEITMDTNAVGKLMGPMFAIKLKSTLNTLLDELKVYVEQGELSAKKRKQLAKAA